MTQQFQYDGLSRLTRAEVPGGNISTFGHDPVGNRTSVVETSPASTTTYAIAATGNQMTQAVTGGMVRPFTYNANGDVATLVGLSGVTNTLTYDPFGRLASHTRAQLTTTYTVNALDQRMAKSNTGSSSRYVYAGFNQLLAEYTNGQWTSYIWNGNAPVAMVRNNQIYYIHTDHLGRPQLATDANRAVVWKASNHAFGRTVAVDAIGGLPLGFPGQYHDTEFGTWHNGYRDYLADTGRYLQSDPIGLAGGINTYAYVGGNPVMYIDPFGLHCMTPEQIGERVGAIEGGIAGAQEGPVGALLGGIAGAVIGRATADLGQLPGAIAAGAGGMVQMAGEGKAGMARGGLSAFVGTAGAASMGPGGAALGPIVGEIASPSSASLAIAISNVMKTSMFAVAGAAAGVAYKKLAEATRDSDCECNQGK